VAFTEPIFIKLKITQEHYVDISHTEFHPNQSKIWKIWVEINLCPEIKSVNFQETHACSVTLKKN